MFQRKITNKQVNTHTLDKEKRKKNYILAEKREKKNDLEVKIMCNY